MHILNSFGLEHFKAQCWLFASFLGDKYAESIDPKNSYELTPKQKIALLPVKLTTIYNEWSKAAGFKSFSDMKAHSNDSTGKSLLHLKSLTPTELIKDFYSKYTPDHDLYSPLVDQDYFIKNHELVDSKYPYLCEYLFYSDPEMEISVEVNTEDDSNYLTEYLVWTRGDLDAGIYSSVYLSGNSMDDLEREAKKNLIDSIRSFSEWI